MSQEAMKLALKRAFQYGVDHWYQADHDSYRENKKANRTLAEFLQFVEKTCKALAEQPAPMIRGDIRDGLVDDEPAQQQQEPVAWEYCEEIYAESNPELNDYIRANGIPLYTSPPAQQLPFGVGGGLVAIKTLLSRDPCAHAKVAIKMIDAMLSEQPAQQQQQQQQQQQPVAWLVCENWRNHSLFFTEEGAEDFKNAAQREDDLSGNLARWKAKPLYTSPPAQRKPLTDKEQIAEALRRHGLTLIKTASGYDVLKLGQIDAHGIKGQP